MNCQIKFIYRHTSKQEHYILVIPLIINNRELFCLISLLFRTGHSIHYCAASQWLHELKIRYTHHHYSINTYSLWSIQGDKNVINEFTIHNCHASNAMTCWWRLSHCLHGRNEYHSDLLCKRSTSPTNNNILYICCMNIIRNPPRPPRSWA